MESIRGAVRDAVKLCRRVQEEYLIANTKVSGEGKEPVTIADYGSQAIICRALQAHYPEDGVVSEESGAQFLDLVSAEQRAQVLEILADVLGEPVSEREVVDWLDHGVGRATRRTWVIDPIDGTKGFLALRHYAIACGALIDGEVAEGILAAPDYNDGEGALFYTENGATWRAPIAGGRGPASDGVDAARCERVRGGAKLRAGACQQIAYGASARAGGPGRRAPRGTRQHGEVRAGRFVAMLICTCDLPRAGSEYAHKIWDHVAGAALVRQAGGMVTDLDGGPLDFSQGETLPNPGMIISNGQCHERVVEAVGRVMGA